jgi:hypothetical protein
VLIVFQNLEEMVRKIVVPGVGLGLAGLAFVLQLGEVNAKQHVEKAVLAKVHYDSEQGLARKLVEEGKLASWECEGFVGYAKTIKNKELLNDIERTYHISIDTVLDYLAQESGFKINPDKPHKHGEKGTGGFCKCRADELVKRMQNEKDPLYFPYYDFSNYRFEKLDEDYDLNTLLKAADIKDRQYKINKEGISIDKVFKKMRDRGIQEKTYQRLPMLPKNKCKKRKRIEECINAWKNLSDGYKEAVVLYAATNGGLGAINVKKNKPSAELIYNASRFIINSSYFRKYERLLNS